MIYRLYTLVPLPGLLMRLWALHAVSAVLQGVLLGLLLPLFHDLLRAEPDFSAATPWLILGASGVLVFMVLSVIATPLSFAASTELSSSVRRQLMQHVATLPLGWFSAGNRTRLARALTADAGHIGQLAVSIGAPSIRALLTPLTVVIVTCFIDWRLALILLAILPPAFLALRRAGDVASDVEIDLERANAQIAGQAMEIGQAQPVLRAAGYTSRETERLRRILDGHREVYLSGLRRAVVPDLTYTAITTVGCIAYLAATVTLLLREQLSVVEAIVALILAVRFLEPLAHLVELIGALRAMDNSVRRIQAMLVTPPLPAADAPVHDAPASDITFTNVDFSYPASRDADALTAAEPTPARALDQVSFHCPAGSTTALVGASGSGKTTVTRLIARFFDVDAGSVAIGGVNVRAFDQQALLADIAIIFQDVYLFDDTIEVNLRIAHPDATAAEIAAAVRSAGLEEVIARLPEGLQTRVGEGGTRLSGGERQRVSIARAFLKPARIVLIDEAASALDAANEQIVARAIADLARDPTRTVLVIAHRPGTLLAADQVITLEAGRVVEHGTPTDLLQRGGTFARLHRQYEEARAWHIASTASAATTM